MLCRINNATLGWNPSAGAIRPDSSKVTMKGAMIQAAGTGVAVPEAGCEKPADPGEAISTKGSFKYAFRKFLQFALDGMK